MIETPKTFILGVGDIPLLLEQEFNEVLIEPEEGYYRFNDLEPVLPYRSRSGLPATYWIQEAFGLDRREVNNLALVKGVVYDDEGQRRIRLYRVGDVQLNPQIPVIGHRIVKEYLQTFIEMSRCWYPYSNDKVFGTGTLHKRFHRFIKPQYMETFNPERLEETPEHLAEVTIEYLRRRTLMPAQDHLFGVFLARVAHLCSTIVDPIADYIVSNPWKQFELQRIQSNDFLLVDKGDYRINAWEAEHLPKKVI